MKTNITMKYQCGREIIFEGEIITKPRKIHEELIIFTTALNVEINVSVPAKKCECGKEIQIHPMYIWLKQNPVTKIFFIPQCGKRFLGRGAFLYASWFHPIFSPVVTDGTLFATYVAGSLRKLSSWLVCVTASFIIIKKIMINSKEIKKFRFSPRK